MPPEDHQDLRLLAIVPAYNEEGMIGRVVRDINRHAPDFNVLVVDDGSVDRTVALAEAEGAMVLRHPFNLGSAAPCSPATSTRSRTATTSPCRSTATASTSPSTCRRCSPR